MVKQAQQVLRLLLEGPLKGGEKTHDDVKRTISASIIGMVRQWRVEKVSAYNGEPPEEQTRRGRAAAKEAQVWVMDPETTDEQLRSELAHVTRMLEEEENG